MFIDLCLLVSSVVNIHTHKFTFSFTLLILLTPAITHSFTHSLQQLLEYFETNTLVLPELLTYEMCSSLCESCVLFKERRLSMKYIMLLIWSYPLIGIYMDSLRMAEVIPVDLQFTYL